MHMFIFLRIFLKPTFHAEIPLVVPKMNNLLWHRKQQRLGQQIVGQRVGVGMLKTIFYTHMVNRWDRRNFFMRNTNHL